MNGKLTNKVAIVTGAGKGIGRAIALALAARNSTVILAARTAENLNNVAQHITGAGGIACPVVTDVADEQSINNLIAYVDKTFGRLDILVNNAGITASAPLEQTSTQDWDRCIAVNARGPFILCRQALPLLKKAPQACIVNIASVVGVKGYAFQSAYTASKHALRGMTISLAEELKGSNIRVHLVCPGGVDTDMVRTVRPDIPAEDLIKPEEIAELVVYLVTHRGNAVIDELRIRRATSPPWFW